jgi:Domain of unknown function (DUF3850)
MTHELKIYPQHYRAVLLGLKKVEVRLNDRNYQERDTLLLNEYCPQTQKYTGFQVVRNVDYILKDVAGLNPNYVIMQISKTL